MTFASISTQTISAGWLADNSATLDILRLDKIDPVISGNKWFKLKYYISDAIATGKETVATFGGAWSNHIIATACACLEAELKSVGIIRGERSAVLSSTLEIAQSYGMELHFINRETYRDKNFTRYGRDSDNWYWINEGGNGTPGVRGASEILATIDSTNYTHIIAAVGTGTTLAGLLLSASAGQQIIGISSMKGNLELQNQIEHLTDGREHTGALQLFHDYHFGGYAKHPPQLIAFINKTYLDHQLPLDIIYTGKTFFAIQDLVQKRFFSPGSRLLMIHTGGLQGNKSLPPEVLSF